MPLVQNRTNEEDYKVNNPRTGFGDEVQKYDKVWAIFGFDNNWQNIQIIFFYSVVQLVFAYLPWVCY